MQPRVLSASSIGSDSVKNPKGDDLGSVKDLMINMNNGSVEYVVVSFGGFLGLGSKYFAIPFDCFSLDTEDKCLRLDVSKEILENLEGFDDDNWPDFANQSWRSRTRSAFPSLSALA